MPASPVTGSTLTNTNSSKTNFFYLENFYYYFALVVLLMTKENMPVVKTSDRSKLEGKSPLWTHPIELLFDLNGIFRDAWVAQSVKLLPSAQVMIPGSWDQVPHQVPCSAGACFSRCLCLPLCLLVCTLSLINK